MLHKQTPTYSFSWACNIWSLKEDQTAVLLLYSPVTLQCLVNLELVRSCSSAFWFRPFVYSEVKLKPSLVSDDVLIVWGLYCLHKWNFFTSFNSTGPFSQWFHSGRDSFMIKRVWQLHCATGRSKTEMRDDWWQNIDERAMNKSLGDFVYLLVVYLSYCLRGEFIWHFLSSLSWEWVFTHVWFQQHE